MNRTDTKPKVMPTCTSEDNPAKYEPRNLHEASTSMAYKHNASPADSQGKYTAERRRLKKQTHDQGVHDALG